MDKKLLAILLCPICKGNLDYEKNSDELVCRVHKLAFPVRDNIPIMLEDEARRIDGVV